MIRTVTHSKCEIITLGTAQVKDIKPGVLSKIMSVTEKGSTSVHGDENSKKLLSVAKGLEETLLGYANYKPSKKIQISSTEGVKKKNSHKDEEENTTKFRNLIDKVFEFK